MSKNRKIHARRERREHRVRSKVKMSAMPRLSVFRSAKHIYGQLIDDAQGKTLVSYSTRQAEAIKGDKKDQAHAVGVELAKQALKHGIEQVAFDRGPFLYHGRVKALADGLREGGLNI